MTDSGRPYDTPSYGGEPYRQPSPGQPSPGQPSPGQPYGGYGGALQQYGDPARDPQAPPPRIEPYVGPPLPPPILPTAAPPIPTGVAPVPPPVLRPAVIGMSATLAVTASLQWICGLSVVWLLAAVGSQSLGTSGLDGMLFHELQRFHYRMIDGLAWPLYLFPLASFVTGLLVLIRRPWARIVHSVVGAGALGWSAWWLRDALVWWIAPAVYVGLACLLLWLPAVGRWYRAERAI